jgi:hypothetical protein
MTLRISNLLLTLHQRTGIPPREISVIAKGKLAVNPGLQLLHITGTTPIGPLLIPIIPARLHSEWNFL